MATPETEKRMERRRHQRWREQRRADPAIQDLRRQIEARWRYQKRHPFSGRHPGLLLMHCIVAGIQQGGRPPMARRCTKRLGTRYCWNWRERASDRCYRHGRQQITRQN
jgi:hypothetical protein